MKILHSVFLVLIICSCSNKIQFDQNERTVLKSSFENRPPNIIIIYADDMGYGDLSSYGNPTIQTPHLDQLAEEGQRWTQFYSPDPVCTPSRAGLLTGRYPIRNGMTSPKRGVFFPDSSGGLPQEEITIAEMLKQKHYATGIFGKWHLGHLPQHLPTTQGFDEFWGIPYSNDMNLVEGTVNYLEGSNDPLFIKNPMDYDVPIVEGLTEVERPANQHTITKRYTEKAIDFINRNADNPFFLYVPHSMPHIPLYAHPDRVGNSDRGLYGDVIEEIDWSVGQIIETLKSQNLEQNSLVVFSSDNGPWLAFKTHGGSSGPLRAGKGTSFEGGQRVPTIFWGPSIVTKGVVTELGSIIDLFETIASITNVESPKDRKMDGIDLSPVLKGESEYSKRDDFFYWKRGQLHAVRTKDWKMHIHSMDEILYWNPVELDQPLLYEIEKDIGEKYDQYENRPEVVAKLQLLIDEHLADTSDSDPEHLSARIE